MQGVLVLAAISGTLSGVLVGASPHNSAFRRRDTPQIPGYAFAGCYTEATGQRALTGSSYFDDAMTIEKCAAACAGYTNFGVEYGRECYCSNTINEGSVQTQLSDCSFACPGNPAENCGAGNRLDMYTRAADVAPTTTSAVVYSYQGCYSEPSSGRALASLQTGGQDMTVEKCAAFCGNAGYSLFGLEYYTECYCGNGFAPGSGPAPETDCNYPCAGDSSEVCGGSWRLNVYALGQSASPVASSVSTSTPSAASVSYTSEGCYTEATWGRALGDVTFYSDAMTVEMCAAVCSSYTWFGLEYARECYCGNSIADGSVSTSLDDCSVPCPGNTLEKCGGGNRLNMYRNLLSAASSSDVATSSSVTPVEQSTSTADATSTTAADAETSTTAADAETSTTAADAETSTTAAEESSTAAETSTSVTAADTTTTTTEMSSTSEIPTQVTVAAIETVFSTETVFFTESSSVTQLAAAVVTSSAATSTSTAETSSTISTSSSAAASDATSSSSVTSSSVTSSSVISSSVGSSSSTSTSVVPSTTQTSSSSTTQPASSSSSSTSTVVTSTTKSSTSTSSTTSAPSTSSTVTSTTKSSTSTSSTTSAPSTSSTVTSTTKSSTSISSTTLITTTSSTKTSTTSTTSTTSAAAKTPTAVNVLTNGDFEGSGAWVIKNTAPSALTYSLVNTNSPHGGLHSASIAYSANSAVYQAWFNQPVTLLPNTHYIFSGWAKASAANPGCAITYYIGTVDGAIEWWTLAQITSSQLATSWTQSTGSFDTPFINILPFSFNVRMTCTGSAARTYFLDDLSLTAA